MMRTREEILQGENEKDFMLKCFFDKSLWCTRVLGLTIKPFHKEWLDIFDKYDRINIRAPTGFGKTQIFGIAIPLHYAYFKPNSQVLVMCKNIRTQSATILEDIKYVTENNEILKELKPNDTSKTWSKDRMITSTSSKIFYSSYTVNVRGSHVDYIFNDEIATWIGSNNYFENVVTRAVSKQGKIAGVSTPVSSTDLQARLFENPSYYCKSYPAIVNYKNGNYATGESIWPEKFPLSLLLKIRYEIGHVMFEKNYMVNPKAEAENAIFPADSIEKCWDHTAKFTTEHFGGTVTIGADFCVAQGPTADYDCFVVTEQIGDKTIIKHGERHRYSTSMKIQRLKELWEMYQPTRIILDESHIGTSVLQDLRSQGYLVEAQSFQHKARNQLLMNLKNLFDNKLIVIPKSRDPLTKTFVDLLEEELIGFKEQEVGEVKMKRLVSTTAHDDTVMALAMACKRAKFNRPFQDCIGSG